MTRPADRIVTSASAEPRLRLAEEWLRETAATHEVLLLAVSRGAGNDLLHAACRQGGLVGVHRMTPLQLITELASRSLGRQGGTPVSVLGVEALAARCIALCNDVGRLEYFRPIAEAPGFARALAGTLTELRLNGTRAAEVEATGKPGVDLARLMTIYEQELDRWSLVDETGLLELACGEIAGGDHRFRGLPVLLLDLPLTSRLHRRFVDSLLEDSPSALAIVPTGDRETLASLEALFGCRAERLDDGSPRDGSKLDRLRRSMFASDRDNGAETVELDDDDHSLVFFSAPGEGRECVEIARRIRMLAGQGVPFDRMAILLRDPNVYLGLVEEALRRARIPAYFTRGTVRPHPGGRAFLALLACAAEKFSASRFAEYLSLGEVPMPDPSGAPMVIDVPWIEPEGDQLVFKTPVTIDRSRGNVADRSVDDPSMASGRLFEPVDDAEAEASAVIAGTLQVPRRWEQLLVDAAVVGGKDRWRRRLAGLEAELQLRMREVEDFGKQENLRRRIVQLGTLKRFALPVIEALAALPRSAAWGEWLEALEKLATLTLRSPERVLAVIAELRPMNRVGPVELEDVRRVLEERLSFLRSEPPRRRHGQVFVATVAEARGRCFDFVFLPGLGEGIFPRRAVEDPLLLDVYRERLVVVPGVSTRRTEDADPAELVGSIVTTQPLRFERERLLLRLASGAAASGLVVSYPSLDTLQGRSRVPSFYAVDLLRAVEGCVPTAQQLRSRAASGSTSHLGWPAPLSPEQAIDDSEYDLSYLEPLLRGPTEETKGRGRFLLQTNANLARSLRMRARRWRSAFSGADGIVDAGALTRSALAEHRLQARSYSPIALQRYAVCPYQFLLYSIHRLRPREEVSPLQQLDPLTRGSLFHEVQFEFFRALQKTGSLPLKKIDRRQLLELSDATLDRVADRYEDQLAPAIPRVWRDEIEGIRTDLRGWILAVLNSDEAWRPEFFEFSFGLGREVGRDQRSHTEEAVILDGLRLRGAIDLIEADDERGVLRVTDHKTGRARRDRYLIVGGGEVLQPLLYALAAEQQLGTRVESGRLFYCTRRGGYFAQTVPLSDANRHRVADALAVVDGAVADGFLPAAPRPNACAYCDYQIVCGPYEQTRVQRKQQQRLRPLLELRGTP